MTPVDALGAADGAASPDDPFATRLRNAAVALAANPGDERARTTLANLLEYGPGAQNAFETVVADLAHRHSIDRRTAVMLRSLALRVHQLGAADDRTLLIGTLTSGAAAPDESTILWGANADDGVPHDGDAHADAAPPPGEGDVLDGRYALATLVGIGGMAIVYRAVDEKTGRTVAVKILKDLFLDTPAAIEAFEQEATRTAQIDDPGVVRILAAGRHGRRPYTVMEYLHGVPLSRSLKKREGRSVTWSTARGFVLAVGRSLGAAHAKGIIHCDMKPSNVFHLSDGSWRVLDFGVAQEIRATARKDAETPTADPVEVATEAAPETAPALEALTPAYASVEQLRHMPPDPRDDIFSLAVITYEMLTGLHPFDRIPADEARNRRLVPPRPDDMPSAAWRALRQGLQFDRERRPKTMAAFLRGLRRRLPVWPTAAAAVIAALAVAAVSDPDRSRQLLNEGTLGVGVAVAFFQDDRQEMIGAALALQEGAGPLHEPILSLVRPAVQDSIRRLATVESEAGTERLRRAARAVEAGRTIYPDEPAIVALAERPFHLLLLDLADRLGRKAPLPSDELIGDVRLLRSSDPDAFAAVEDVVADLIFERMRRIDDRGELEALNQAARQLFPEEQWVKPIPPN